MRGHAHRHVLALWDSGRGRLRVAGDRSRGAPTAARSSPSQVLFTAAAPAAIGVFDRDVDRLTSLARPELYKQGMFAPGFFLFLFLHLFLASFGYRAFWF